MVGCLAVLVTPDPAVQSDKPDRDHLIGRDKEKTTLSPFLLDEDYTQHRIRSVCVCSPGALGNVSIARGENVVSQSLDRFFPLVCFSCCCSLSCCAAAGSRVLGWVGLAGCLTVMIAFVFPAYVNLLSKVWWYRHVRLVCVEMGKLGCVECRLGLGQRVVSSRLMSCRVMI